MLTLHYAKLFCCQVVAGFFFIPSHSTRQVERVEAATVNIQIQLDSSRQSTISIQINMRVSFMLKKQCCGLLFHYEKLKSYILSPLDIFHFKSFKKTGRKGEKQE